MKQYATAYPWNHSKSIIKWITDQETWLKHDNDNNSVNISWDLAKRYIFANEGFLFLQLPLIK